MATFSESNITTSFMYRGVCQELPKIGSIGDICLCEDNEYVWVNSEWLPLGEIDKPLEDKPIVAKICSRCGAPLKGHKCEYCGTEYGQIGDN